MYKKKGIKVIEIMVLWAFYDQGIDMGQCGEKWRLCMYLWGICGIL